MISIDISQLDSTSFCVGATALILSVKFIVTPILVKIVVPAIAILQGKSRETVINELVEGNRARFEKLLPHWTVNR